MEESKPPCDFCKAYCCKQYGGHQFAVWLVDEDEPYPEESTYRECVGPGKYETIRVLPFVDGKCVYLENDKCSVYEKRPTLCKKFNCVVGYKSNRNNFFLDDNPQVVQIIEKYAK